MKAFGRVFTYIWPQWPRIIVVVLSAIMIGVLLSVSIMTIIPLLNVMIADEGLHGWVDRKVCETRYGLRFHAPTASELANDWGPALRTHLRVTSVEENSLAALAGIRPQDRLTLVGVREVPQDSRASYTRLLQELAATRQRTVGIEVRRPQNGEFGTIRAELATPYNVAQVNGVDWGSFKRLRWRVSLCGLGAAQWAVAFLPREPTPRNQVKAVVAIMGAMLVITLARCVAKFYQDYLGQKIVQVGVNHMREDLFAHLTEMPVGAFANERPSDAVSRIVRDTTILGTTVKVLLGKGLREPMIAVFMLAGAMVLNWQLTLIFLGGGPFVLLLFSRFGSKMKKATRRSLVASSQMLAKLQEAMAGLRVVKVYNRQQHEQALFKAINDRLLKQLLHISKVDAASHPILEVLGMLAGSAAIIVGMTWVTAGGLAGPDFLALLALLGISAEAVRKTSDIWNKLQQANAAAERIFNVLDQPREFEKAQAVALPPAKGHVEFREVVFTYPHAERPALDGVNLTVIAGHNVAIVGPNGSGKTTLANLLPRFYDPDSGQVLVDGHDVRDVTLDSLRRQIGMVTQQVITFNDTIGANIGYGRQGATQEQIVDAARRAFADEFIGRLPNGYETVIGEHGAGLSGGQLQRIVIARAILRNPAILIFDEATSQVDADSEAKIHRAIEEIMRDRTTFIIAHRFSTVVAADVIVVMDRGTIVAQGQHEELMQTSRLYQGLYETQLVGA